MSWKVPCHGFHTTQPAKGLFRQHPIHTHTRLTDNLTWCPTLWSWAGSPSHRRQNAWPKHLPPNRTGLCNLRYFFISQESQELSPPGACHPLAPEHGLQDTIRGKSKAPLGSHYSWDLLPSSSTNRPERGKKNQQISTRQEENRKARPGVVCVEHIQWHRFIGAVSGCPSLGIFLMGQTRVLCGPSTVPPDNQADHTSFPHLPNCRQSTSQPHHIHGNRGSQPK